MKGNIKSRVQESNRVKSLYKEQSINRDKATNKSNESHNIAKTNTK